MVRRPGLRAGWLARPCCRGPDKPAPEPGVVFWPRRPRDGRLNLETAVDRFLALDTHYEFQLCAHQQGHLNGDNATHPIEPRWRTPAALLLLARRSPQRCQPCRPQSSQRLAFFALSRCAWAHLEPQRSPCRPQSRQRLAFFALSRCARAHLEPQRSPCQRTHRSPIGRIQLRFPG